jgi:hypothetical protein
MHEIRAPAGNPTVATSPARTPRTHLPGGWRQTLTIRLLVALACLLAAFVPEAGLTAQGAGPVYEVRPIGWIRKANGKTTIEVERQYQPALLGVEHLETIWVL